MFVNATEKNFDYKREEYNSYDLLKKKQVSGLNFSKGGMRIISRDDCMQ